MKKTILPIFIILVLIFFSFEIPNYYNYVNDFANLISDSYEIKINNLLKVLDETTSVEIAILTLSSINNNSIEEVAVKVFEKWKIGKKGKDNGILIILAYNERKVRIEVGYGLEGDIPDIKAKDFLDSYGVPYFKEGNFNDGFYILTLRLAKEICKVNELKFEDILKKAQIEEQNYDKYFKNNEDEYGGKSDPIFIIFIIIMFLLFFRFFPNFLPFLIYMNIGGGGYFGRNNSNFKGGGFGGFGGGRSGGGGATSSF
ncbi:MAG: TPM domain-containing protein [Spirochaetes bacterium]|nr:TPM domain-containing protein [Spirochaetota bacterium]